MLPLLMPELLAALDAFPQEHRRSGWLAGGVEDLAVRKPADLGPAFDAAVRQDAEALLVGLDALTRAESPAHH